MKENYTRITGVALAPEGTAFLVLFPSDLAKRLLVTGVKGTLQAHTFIHMQSVLVIDANTNLNLHVRRLLMGLQCPCLPI